MAEKTITKRLDKQGRLVIPIEFLNHLHLYPLEKFEITLEYGEICIRKFNLDNVDLKEIPNISILKLMDKQHRIQIPENYKKLLGITNYDLLSIVLHENEIHLSKV